MKESSRNFNFVDVRNSKDSSNQKKNASVS